MTETLPEAREADYAIALRHLGFESVEDIHYWATDNNELRRFDELVRLFAEHRLAAEERQKERDARVAENNASQCVSSAEKYNFSDVQAQKFRARANEAGIIAQAIRSGT